MSSNGLNRVKTYAKARTAYVDCLAHLKTDVFVETREYTINLINRLDHLVKLLSEEKDDDAVVLLAKDSNLGNILVWW